MNDPAPPPPRFDLANVKAYVFSVWGMTGLLTITNLMMVPVMIGPKDRMSFLLFVSAMLAHLFIQFLVSVAVEDISYRRKPRKRVKRQIQAMQLVLLLLVIPPFLSAYF